MLDDEKGKVIDFVQHLGAQGFEEEQVRIAEKRLEDCVVPISALVSLSLFRSVRRLRRGSFDARLFLTL